MFYDVSLCPGGAFMMHESVAEFDPNVATPVNPPQNVEMLKSELNAPGCDAVLKLITKTRPIYEKVKALGSLNLEPDSLQEAISDLEHVSTVASEVAEEMRMRLVKQAAVRNMMEDIRYEWVNEDFIANMKFFMLHKNRIKQMGYSHAVAEYTELRQLAAYNVVNMLASYMAITDDLPDYPFDMDNMRNAYKSSYGEGMMDCFASTHDMFNCMFEDPDRLIRLEAPGSWQIELDDMFSNVSWKNADVAMGYVNDPCCGSDHKFYATMIAYISHQLRLIKRGAYDLSCNIMDSTGTGDATSTVMDNNQYHKKMRSLISGVYDIFYLSMIWLFSNAYRIRKQAALRQATSDFVKVAMNSVKNG